MKQLARSVLMAIMGSLAAFCRHVCIDADGESAVYADVADEFQTDGMKVMEPALSRVANRSFEAPPYSRAYLERPRGHSKTTDIAIATAWVLLSAIRKIQVVVAAADRDQARLVRDAVDTLLRLNPWLGELLDVQNYRIVNKQTGSECIILASDVASSYGLTSDIIIADELTHWPKRELWDSLISTAAKRQNSVVLVISNAGHRPSWQWDVREAARTSPDWYFDSLPGPVASRITDGTLAEQRRMLPPSVYARLWQNEWREDGIGDYLKSSWIKRATTLPGEAGYKEPHWFYVGGLDLSKFRDRSAFVVVAVDTVCQRMHVVAIREWEPGSNGEISITEIKQEILALRTVYGFRSIRSDTFASFQLSEDLGLAGINHTVHHSTLDEHTAMCKCLLAVFRDDQIGLYPHEGLIDDLRKLRIVERANDKLKLEADRDNETGHADAGFALANAIREAFVQMHVQEWEAMQAHEPQRILV